MHDRFVYHEKSRTADERVFELRAPADDLHLITFRMRQCTVSRCRAKRKGYCKHCITCSCPRDAKHAFCPHKVPVTLETTSTGITGLFRVRALLWQVFLLFEAFRLPVSVAVERSPFFLTESEMQRLMRDDLPVSSTWYITHTCATAVSNDD